MTHNPFSAENVAEQSFRMFCKAALVDIKKLTVRVPDIPDDLMVGQEIEVTIFAEVVDVSTGSVAQDSSEKVTLPLVLTGRSAKTGELFFRVAQRVINWWFTREGYSICWSASDLNGARVWFICNNFLRTDWRTDWTEYCEIEGTKRRVPMVFADTGQTQAMHPELAHAA